MSCFEVAVLIPRMRGGGRNRRWRKARQFDKADAFFNQLASQQGLFPVGSGHRVRIIDAIQLVRRGSFIGEVADLRNRSLHAKRGLIVLDRGVDLLIA